MQGLQPLPSGLLSLFTLPLGRLVLRAALAEPFVPSNRLQKNRPALPSAPPAPHETAETDTSGAAVGEEDDDDESVDSFFSRRFGDAFARTLGSALVHGIYAADSRLLSLRAAFPQLHASEARGNGSVIWGELGPSAWFGSKAGANSSAKSQQEGQEEEQEVGDREWETRLVRTAALFSFREGMETLVRGLVEALRGFPNVALRSGAAVRGIGIDATADNGDDDDDRCSFQVRGFRLFFILCVALRLSSQIYLDAEGEDGGAPLGATHVISALPLPVLDSILQAKAGATAAATEGGASTTHTSLPHLRANPHSSVTVLNLVFPTSPPGTGESTTTTTTATAPLHPPGFGYLIPRPEHGYPEPGREDEEDPGPGLLGVVFDSASLPEQDQASDDNDAAAAASAAGFIKLTAMLGGPYPFPHARETSESDAQLVTAVLPRISSQLGHALPPPVHYAVHRNVESIPTYLVGHTARMGELRRALSERWGGRMKVVGAGVGGVSVADCVKAGRQAAFEVGAQIKSQTSGG